MEDSPDLRILFVEDLPEDAEITVRELRRAGLRFDSRRVDTKEDFLAALDEFEPELIVSDYAMPRFDGMKALRLSLERDPSVPFIVLTGSKNEETAVLCLKSGASDYIIKGHISRLPFAIHEALEHARASREREASVRELRESEQRFRTLADSGQALIWTSGKDMLCNYFNRPWLEFTGRSLEEEVGNGWTTGVHPEDLERCVATYVAAFEGREAFSMEYRIRRRDGEYRWIMDDGCPRYDAAGLFLGYIGHCLDITPRKRAEERLEKALEEKETLLRELFHRTRNNMQVIMAILAFEESVAGDTAVAEVVKRTSDRIMSMSLVHQKLYESQDLSRVDLKGYAEDLLALIVGDESFPRERISVALEAEPISVLIDTAVPFGLVLHELLSNAFRHAYPGDERGIVQVSIARSGPEGIELVVSDEGVGLPEGFDYRRRESLGYQIILGLGEQQLGGRVELATREPRASKARRGLACSVIFPDRLDLKRL